MPSKKLVARVACFLVIFIGALHFYGPSPKLVLTHINQWSIEVERRLLWWDWQDTPEEVACQTRQTLSPSKAPIPKVVHFIFLAPEDRDTELTLWDFLAIKAALVRIQPDALKIHSFSINKQNQYWKQLEHRITSVLHDRKAVLSSMGTTYQDLGFAHQADILRLDIMKGDGGIYFDSDVFAIQSFNDLLTNNKDVIMGHEGGNRYGLCNAVILSRPSSWFVTKWRAAYASFNPKVWNEHSVLLPKRMSVQYPEMICTLSPTAFFWPTWHKDHIKYMHEPISADEAAEMRANMTQNGGGMYKNQLAYHAWGNMVRKQYLSHLSTDDVLTKDTRFNILIREIVTATV